MGRLSVAVGFSGKIKSGKTTISQRVADQFGTKRASFGDFVRSICLSKQLNVASRDVLQAVGEATINEQGWPKFCASLLEFSDWEPNNPIVIDGIRHTEALHHLRVLLAPLQLVLVYVDVSQAIQDDRFTSLDGSTSLQTAMLHSTERDVESSLKDAADLVVSGVCEVDHTVSEINEFLSEFVL